MNLNIKVISAYTQDGAYGLKDSMPWPKGSLPGDLSRFKKESSSPHGLSTLICGSATFKTMASLPLGKERILVGVSSKIFSKDYGSGFGPGRYFCSSFEEALRLTKLLKAAQACFIGGESSWLFGLPFAHELILTVAKIDCPGGDYTRLKVPLHILAKNQGFIQTEKESLTNKQESARARHYDFERWTRV